MPDPVKILGVDGKIVFAILAFVLIIPSGYFVASSIKELNAIQKSILEPPKTVLESFIDTTSRETPPDQAIITRYELQVLALAERDTILQRNLRARAALATRTWLYFMCLIFGTILAVIGVSFVLGRIAAPVDANIEGSGFKLTLVTSSPGLIIALFGCLLVGTPIVMQTDISVNDSSAYLYPRSVAITGEVGVTEESSKGKLTDTEIDDFLADKKSGGK